MAPSREQCGAKSVQCHYCNNRITGFEWQSKHDVKLKPRIPAAETSPSTTTITSVVTKLRTSSLRLDRCETLQTIQSPSETGSNHSSRDSSHSVVQCPSVRLKPCWSAFKSTNVSMERPPFKWYLCLVVLLSCISVISTSRYVHSEPNSHSYSHYYPPYLQEAPSFSQNRKAKSNSRVFSDSQHTPSARDNAKIFLDPITFKGGEVTGIKVLRKPSNTGINHDSNRPDYHITSDIVVEPNSRLEIEPGVRLAFAPQVGVTVYGALQANGTSSSKIVFTVIEPEKLSSSTLISPGSSSFLSTGSNKPILPSIRLVDGNIISEGRLQINYKGRWHSVCTNSRNWTQVDVQVVCRQLGFSGGQWYRWFARNNDSRQFMYEHPGCQGQEHSIQDCNKWPSRRIGSGVCDFHQDIGIRCDFINKHDNQHYWKGVHFVNPESQISTILSNKMEISVSKSFLRHVTLEYAGRESQDRLSSALQVISGVPPVIDELTIRRCAYTALNITDPLNGFQVTNSRFIENRGYGVYINSSVGRVYLSSIEVEDNGADGIRFVHFDKPYYSPDSFCQTPNLGTSQVFPIKYTHKQSASKVPTEECCQEFYARDWEGQRITVHFPVLASGIDDFDRMSDLVSPPYLPHVGREGSIYVVDGHSGRIIADFVIRNNTKTQSVSSISGNGPLKVCYRPAHYRKVLFTVKVVVDYGREYDLVIADSRIVANNGRGVWLQNLRSGAVLNRTLVARHDYVAGIHVSDGVGELIVNNSIISNNLADGVNITTGGGFLHIDRTDIVNNTERGIAYWFNESIALQAFNFSSHITRCPLSRNRVGLFISGGCHFYASLKQSPFWNVSMNVFSDQYEQAILYHTCVPRPRILKMQMKPVVTNFSINHNRFEANGLHALHMAPLFFAKVNIIHNEFTQHKKAVMYINSRNSFNVDKFVEDAERFPFLFYSNDKSLSNQRRLALDSWPVVVRIRNNNFNRNKGQYIASIGLLEPESIEGVNFNSLPQKMLFTRNILRENTAIESFANLNSRSKVSCVLCVTSSNVLIWRNEFVNPQSQYELGVHLAVHYRIVNASLNYWGTANSMSNFNFDDKNLHSAAAIYERIFDRKNRYNLAQVEFLPYILIPNALESDRSALSQVNDRDKILQFFSEDSSGEIGGQVRGQVNLPPGIYNVKRDIYISPEGELVLNPGTELYFDQSVGIFVQGKFKAKGTMESDIKFLLSQPLKSRKTRETVAQNNTQMSNASSTPQTSQQSKPSPISLKLSHSPSYSAQSIRLSNGTEGRLEVKIGNEWGTVCGYNFDIEDAAVACHQLGLVLNERDWRLEKSEFWSAGNSRAILLTNLQCSHLDTDLTKCRAERISENDFEGGWCPVGEVGIRCFPPAWAGIRFGMLTQETVIESVTIEKAGLLDYQTRKFMPALQFDLNRFSIRNSIIRSNIDSGIGLMWNDVLSEQNDDILQITDTKIVSNLNHGIVTRTQGIQIKDCYIAENKVSGFHYEPSFTREEQEDLASWVVKQPIHNRKVSVFVIPSNSQNSNSPYNQSIFLGDIGKQVYVYIPRRPTTNNSPYRVMIKTDVGRRIGVMVVNPIFQTRSSETLKLYSPQLESSYIPKMMWDLRRNLTGFPFVYPGYRLVLEYSTGDLPYGGILLLFTPKTYLRSVPGAPTIVEQGLLEQRHMNSMHILRNEFIQNGKGITSSHCSMNVDFNGNYCKRYANETVLVEKNRILKSKGAGLFVNSFAFSSNIPYSLLLNMLNLNETPQSEDDVSFTASIIAEINYTLIDNRFANNADFGSIVLYDHSLYENGDMQRSSIHLMPGFVMSNALGANYPSNTNLYHWNIINCTLEDNRNGGVDLQLPYTWLYNENFTHTVVVQDSRFLKNQNFEFMIGGHYAKVNVTRNMFVENQCKTGLISIKGMEKLMKIERNEISNNYVQRFVIELNMASHADKFGTVKAFIRRNVIRNNRFSGQILRENPDDTFNKGYSPETYTISIRGVQQVNVTRNILVNRNLQFELLAGVRAGSLKNELDARENWWGVGGDPSAIRERIFDFDDWNSFSSTIFSPWLSTDRLDAPVVYEQTLNNDEGYQTVPYYLGGRLTKSTVLVARDRPYVVNSDLTVMPGVTLTLRPGVVMEFYPSVGILVLGELAAIGFENKPITLRPFYRNATIVLRSKSGEEGLTFRLTSNQSTRNRRLASQPHTEQLVFSKSDIGGVRLCLTESCDPDAEIKADSQMKQKINWPSDTGYPNTQNGRRRHGFLEIYNSTTLQWSPVCDPRFTERNAQVVCRQLGFSTLNVFVRRGPRLDMDPTLMTRVKHWPDALECIGSESTLSDCDMRTFSKDSFDTKSSVYESAPFYHAKAPSKNMFRKDSYYNFMADNQTREMMFYMNDDWSILDERPVIQSTSCQHDSDEFVYIFCGPDNNKETDGTVQTEHWGGIRFALPAFEESDRRIASKKKLFSSTMQFVRVIGAGILHGEKSAAVQLIQRSVPIEFITVERSAYHGIEVIAPPDSLSLHQLQLKNNLGSGINLLLLGASSSESQRVPYQPLGDGSSFSVPYNAFSLVDICDARKELRIGEKMLVYYKYDNKPVDCVKIFTSVNPLKRVGFRFLQLNLWSKFVESEGKPNGLYDDYLEGRKFAFQSEDIFHNKVSPIDADSRESYVDEFFINSMSDSVLIWDGDIFNETTRRLLGEVYSDSTKQFLRYSTGTKHSFGKTSRNSRYTMDTSTKLPPLHTHSDADSDIRLYKSTGFSLSIQLHASGASGRYGFIAEITTLPSAYYADRIGRDFQHNITYSDIKDNTAGAILYRSVGEVVPPLALLNNVVSGNCRHMWANFSTCESSTIQLEMQNAQNLYFQNNLVSNNNAGGVRIQATSYTAVSALNAYLSNNLFSDNSHKETLYFEGANTGLSYQTIHADRNYFTRNRCPHWSNIVFGRALVKFYENIIINNYGDSQLFVAGFVHAQSSSKLQRCTRNFFYNNQAVNARGEQSTIIVSTVGQTYTDNYLVNPNNDFELSTRNRTIISSASYSLKQNLLQPTEIAAVLASAIVEAPYNWWGFNETSAVEARIKDSRDYYHLIPVEYSPFYTGNWSVLSGSCYGGYEKIADTCFVYVGGRMTYSQARRFCEKDNSSMPFVRAANQAELTRYVYIQRSDYNRRRHPVWVQSFDVPIGSCSVLMDGAVRVHNCDDELPFLCERDPEIGINTATLDFWYQEPLGIASIAISLITALLSLACICCWICKSRHRHLEKMERRNSIRASIRSSRSFASSMNTLNSDGNYFTNRKLLHSSANNVPAALTLTNPSSTYRQQTHVTSNPTGSIQQNGGFSGSISSNMSIFTEPNYNENQMLMGQKRFTQGSKPNIFNIRQQELDSRNNSNLNLVMRPTFDLMYENQAFKGQSTPISPASFSSREDTNPMVRAWTPETNSTLDFKVKPQNGPRELSDYTTSTDNIHKSLQSSSSSSASSHQSASPSSILSRSSQQPNIGRFQNRYALRSPGHPPPPPPVRSSIRKNKQAQVHRQSMDPTLLIKNLQDSSGHKDPSDNQQLLTFGSKAPSNVRRPNQPFTTDLDEDTIGGSQPSLFYSSYKDTPSIGTQESNMHYLETSLDGDSIYGVKPSEPSHSAKQIVNMPETDAATAQMYASQPLETAM